MTPERADHRGVALVGAILLLLLLSVTGLGLVLTAALEPLASRNFDVAAAARLAAEAGVTVAARELTDAPDWTAVLRGAWRPALLEMPVAAGPVVIGVPAPSWSGLTNLATCGREPGCSEAQRRLVTRDRPWGANNPSWTWLGVLRIGEVSGRTGGTRFEVGVWVGDDQAEVDGDAATDGGDRPGEPAPPSPGAGVLRLRAEAFGLRGEHAGVEVVLVRGQASGTGRLIRGTPAG
jgi:hypothetical protein